MPEKVLSFRQEVHSGDLDEVREIVKSSGFFSDDEIGIAVELVQERLVQGEKSGYFFLFAERVGRIAGYTCYGPIPGSLHSYDLYWIAVQDGLRHAGIGKELLARSEALIRQRGGKRIYIETSSRPQYTTTLAFYRHFGYREAAFLEDFYAPGDGKIVLVKVI
jgi:ribosomal protein S18 acetylase RimI-like enzyme